MHNIPVMSRYRKTFFLAFFLIWEGCGSVVVVLGRDADHTI